MQDISAWAGLIGEHEALSLALKSADELVDVAVEGADRSDEVRRIGPVGHGVGDADGVLVDVQTDEKRSRLLRGRPPGSVAGERPSMRLWAAVAQPAILPGVSR